MAVNIHITIIELNALHTKRQNLFQELDAVIHLLMEAKHWGLRKSRNATSLNSRFKSLDTLKVKIISVTFRRVIRTNHKKASKIWRDRKSGSAGMPRPNSYAVFCLKKKKRRTPQEMRTKSWTYARRRMPNSARRSRRSMAVLI